MGSASQLLALRHLDAFACEVVRDEAVPDNDYRFRKWWYHVTICRAIEDLVRFWEYKGARGGISRLSISEPPQHGKSLHGAELLPSWALGRRPDARILLGTYSGDFAKRAINNTRKLMKTPAYSSIFNTRVGNVKVEPDADAAARSRTLKMTDGANYFETSKLDDNGCYIPARGYYLAQGMGGQVTGRGADIGIIDDLIKNAQEAMSAAHLAAMWSFYRTCFNTRGSPFAVQLYIATRWTNPDFAEQLLDYWRIEGHPVRELRFSAICTQEDKDEGDPREVGEALDNPAYRPPSFYEKQRRGLESRDPHTWAAMWQQRPTQGGAVMFPPTAWRRFGSSFDLAEMSSKFTGGLWFSIDCAATGTGASFTVIVVAGVVHTDDCEMWFQVDEGRGHWGLREMVIEYRRLHAKWSAALPRAVGMGKTLVEAKALGPAMVAELQHDANDYQLELCPKIASKSFCHALSSDEVRKTRYWLPMGQWGEDPTCPGLPLIDDQWVGKQGEKGTFIDELASTGGPKDRADAVSQLVIYTSRYCGPHLLAVRG